jgi:epoxyqueuosine reductase QueG
LSGGITHDSGEGQAPGLTEELAKFAQLTGVDLLGFADVKRFDGVPAAHHPASIFPETRTVVIVGKRIVRGALRGVEEGTQFDIYARYGYEWLENRFLAMCTFKVGEFLEDHGWEAVPLLDLPPQIPAMGVSVAMDRPAPNVLLDIEQAAVRAGLGEIGYLDVFLSPQFGPRQRLQALLTDAPLQPTPLFSGLICDRTPQLADLCPLGAIDPGKEQILEICGKPMRIAKVDYRLCRDCRNGALPNRWHPCGKPDRLAAVCVRSYLDALERKGRLGAAFVNGFREREPWFRTGSSTPGTP